LLFMLAFINKTYLKKITDGVEQHNKF